MWILYTTIYALLIGFFTVLRKIASQKSNILFVLAFSSTLGFVLISWSPDVLVSVVSIIKQLSTIVAVIFGGLLYKEPNLKMKLAFLFMIMAGIVIVVKKKKKINTLLVICIYKIKTFKIDVLLEIFYFKGFLDCI